MSKQTVTVEDGWDYFTVEEYRGDYTVERWEKGTFSDTNKGSIGKSSSMKDALTLIRSYTGKEIDKIS